MRGYFGMPMPYPQQAFPQRFGAYGCPAQGFPGQGCFPAQGMPAQGMPAQGMQAQGMQAQAMQAQGCPAQGSPAQGAPGQGSPAQGSPAQGSPAQGSAGSAASTGSDRYVALTEGNDGGEFVIQTLVGEFLQRGENHGRPFFQKEAANPGGTPPNVFLYYWDHRDGADFEGWWFGKSVGGNEVWSHCPSSAMQPPGRGWKIPFAGPARPTFVVQRKAQPNKTPAQRQSELRDQQLADEISTALLEAASIMETAHATVGDYSSAEALNQAEKSLGSQAAMFGELQKKVQASQTWWYNDAVKTHVQKLHDAHSALNALVTKIRTALPQALRLQQEKAVELRDQITLQEMLREANAEADVALEMVDKAAAEFAQGEDIGEDRDAEERAIAATEAAAARAQQGIKGVLARVGQKLVSVKHRLQTEKVREEASEKLNEVRNRIIDAKTKLNPLSSARQEFAFRATARQMLAEALGKLDLTDESLSRATQAATPLQGSEAPSAEVLAEIERGIIEASENLTTVSQLLDQKKQAAPGSVPADVEKVESRAAGAQKMLDNLRSIFKGGQEREACASLLRDVGDRMQQVRDSIVSAEAMLGPSSTGGRSMPIEQNMEALRTADAAVTAANKAASAARIAISMKLVEMKRFTSEAALKTQAQLQEHKGALESAMEKIQVLRGMVGEWKAIAHRDEAEHSVSNVEELAGRIAEFAAPFADTAKVAEMSAEQLREVGGATRKAQMAASAALGEAQKLLATRQIEAKNTGGAEGLSAEFTKLQTRLRSAQSEVSKYKTLPSAVEQQLEIKDLIDEASTKVTTAEEKVKAATVVVTRLDVADPAPPDGDKAAGEKPLTLANRELHGAQLAAKGMRAFLELQTRAGKIPQAELAKFQARMAEAEKQLDATMAAMREGSEKLMARELIVDSEKRVTDVEEAVRAASAAAAPLLKEGGELGEEEEKRIMTEFSGTASVANKAINSAKTFISVKRIAAKRFSDGVAQKCTDELAKMQERVDKSAEALVDVIKEANARKFDMAKMEANQNIAEIEAKLKADGEAAEATCNGSQELTFDEMKERLGKASATHDATQVMIVTLRGRIIANLNEAKAAQPAAVSDFKELLEKVSTLQGELERQRQLVAEREDKFVAQRLLQDSSELFLDMEGKLERLGGLAKPFVTGSTEEYIVATFMSHIIDLLKQYAASSSKTATELFREIAGAEGKLTEAQFLSFMKTLPEINERDDEPKLKAVFKQMASGDADEVKEEEFVKQLHCRYVCMGSTPLMSAAGSDGANGKIRMLDVDEVVEGLGLPTKDASTGLTRVKVRAEKDGQEGYTTLADKAATYLEACTSCRAQSRLIDASLAGIALCLTRAADYLKVKSEELKSSLGAAPVGEVKAEMMKLRTRLNKVQTGSVHVRKKMFEAQRDFNEFLEAEKQRREDSADRATAAAMMSEATKLVDAVELEVGKVMTNIEVSGIFKAADLGNPLEVMDRVEEELGSALVAVRKVQDKILVLNMAEIRSSTKAPIVEARRSMFRLKVRLAPLETRCIQQTTAVQSARKQVVIDAQHAIVNVMRGHAQKNGITVDALFSKLAGESGSIPADKLRRFLEDCEGAGLTPTQLDLGLRQHATVGITRFGLLGMLQEYQRCVKEIALTTDFEVKGSTTIRKLDMDEIVEVLGERSLDKTVGVERVRCRTLRDNAEGWVTLRGNQGTAFLVDEPKPYYVCQAPVPCQEACSSASAEVCTLRPGETFEVLEGPRREPLLEVSRVRGRALRDGRHGWATMRAAHEEISNFEPAGLLVCRGSIAMTRDFDILGSDTVRKLAVGETLEKLEEPQMDEARKLMRVKVKAKNDGLEGWATMKGNQGTTYVGESEKHFVCVRDVMLHGDFASDSRVVRILAAGEIFEILEGPSKESKEGAYRVRGRRIVTTAGGDEGGEEGWLTIEDRRVRPWKAK